MKTSEVLNGVDVVVLCGGQGTRLRLVVSDRPKGMAEVEGRPFLEIIVRKLLKQGFRRIIFCTGYLADHIEEYFKKQSYPENPVFEFSREEKPLGTGGALKNALSLSLVKSDKFFVINGDTFSDLDFVDFYSNYSERESLLSMALVRGDSGNGQGNVSLADNDIISSFVEESKEKSSGFASAGCYLMNRRIQEYFPVDENFSLEHDLFPKLAGKSYGFVFEGKFLDIGTPDRYASARNFFI